LTDRNNWVGEKFATGVHIKVSKELMAARFPALVDKFETPATKPPALGEASTSSWLINIIILKGD